MGKEFIASDRLQNSISEAHQASLEILRSEEGQIGVAILPSLRRVACLRGERSAPYTNIADIQYDAVSFANLPFSKEQIYVGLSAIQRLAAAYYPVAELKARFLPGYYRPYDSSWNIFLTQEIAEKKIWRNWEVRAKTPEEQAVSLRMAILGTLKTAYLPTLLGRYENQGRTGVTTVPYEDDERFLWEKEFNYRYEGDGYLFDVLGSFCDATRSLQLPQIFYLIEQLGFREQLAILKKFGYYRPEETINQHYLSHKVNNMVFKTDLLRGIEFLNAMINNRSLRGDETPSMTIAAIIKSLEKEKVLHLKGRVNFYGSPRAILYSGSCLGNSKFLAKLTVVEKQVLELALQTKENAFLHTDEEIAAKMGLRPGHIRNMLTKIGRVFTEKKQLYVSTNGKKLRADAVQHQMIGIRQSDKDGFTEKLSPLEKSVFAFLTTSNGQGRYPTREKTKGQFRLGSDKFFGKLYKKITFLTNGIKPAGQIYP